MTVPSLRPVLRVLFIISLCTAGCRSADRVIIRNQQAPLETPLPPLQLRVDPGSLADTDGAYPDDAEKLFDAEMHLNILEPTDSSTVFGYATLRITDATVTRTGKGFQAFQMMTLMVPSLFGLPIENYCTWVKAELQILDARGRVLGTYTGTGQSNIRVAIYHGYSQTLAPRLADLEAVRSAFAQIRPHIRSDAATLRQELLQQGPVVPQVLGATY